MGKHERQIVEEAEIITAKLINGEPLSSREEKHIFLHLIKKYIPIVKSEYPNIKKAFPIGNNYSTPGDIYLELDNKEKVYIELKFLEKNGSGTLANISQNAMTLLNIFKCQHWSDFRESHNHRQNVIAILNQFPDIHIQPTDPSSKIYQSAKLLKNIIKAGARDVKNVCKEHLASNRSTAEQKMASKLILNIIDMDRQMKINYLSLIKKSQIDKDRLKKFTFLLLTGNHTQEILEYEMGKEFINLRGNINNYSIYYLYKETLEIKKEDNLTRLFNIIFNNDINIEIKDNETSLIVYSQNGEQKTNLIRVVYHWKNKFQGIETPCLNIFKS